MHMMLEVVDNLLKVYRSIGPLSYISTSTCQRRRATVKGTNDWATVRDATTGHAVKGALFYIPPDHASGQPLRLKEFKLEAARPYIYDRFIGAWGMFLHHDQVPLYFAKHIYAEFVLDMHPDYTNTPSNFYGVGGGRSVTHPGARRDPAAQQELERLVGIPSRTLLRIEDVGD